MPKHKTQENPQESSCNCSPYSAAPKLVGSLKHGAFAAIEADEHDAICMTVSELKREDVERPVIFVGAGTCGLGAGAGKTIEAASQYLESKKINADLVKVGCVGLCSDEPILDVQLPGRSRLSFGNVTEDKVDALLDDVFAEKPSEEQCLGQITTGNQTPWNSIPAWEDHPFMKGQTRLVLANGGIIDPASIDEYIARGGYNALFKTLKKHTPAEVCDTVLQSGLRGRGGGGFPTGQKWKFALAEECTQKYLICNADEGDPGAFMDRAVCESDPHRLLEGMAIAAYAIGASKAYIYIRAEYPLAIERLEVAIEQARQYGLIGRNILDSGFNLEFVIKMGAGAFVCGEETALIHSIEGKRGMPRPRPPFPAKSGLFEKPTIINNVETLSNVPSIISLGADHFAGLGTEKSKGTKVYALSGMVNRTGLVEVAMGTTIRDVVMEIGGGIPGGKACKAVQIGGPSGGCIPEPHLDIATDYEALKEFGAIMGSGGLVVMDQSTCMVDLAKYFMEFIQAESCGKCIPCREGTRRMLEILQSLTESLKDDNKEDALLRFQGIMHLEQLAEVIRSTSLCGLGQTAPNPVLATLKWFREEYEAHIFDRDCPAGTCKELAGAPCQTGCPVDTEVWRYVAHVSHGELNDAYGVIRQANPLPAACARVCHHPCETACRCGSTGGDPIAVRSLKRYVVDSVDPAVFQADVKPAGKDSKRVAVIGAGPAGLTAAHMLSCQGHKVTIFEKESTPGGMLTCAIPEYRLPRQVLHKEIQALFNQNVTLEYNVCLGKDITLDGLREAGFNAVFVAIGSHVSRSLGMSGEDAKGILPGIDFLKAYNLHKENLAVGRVGIIGGGNSAVDAARVAIRQEGVTDVTIYYRRGENEMPAYREEIDAALEEGIKIEPLVAPTAVLSQKGVLTGVTFQRNELGAPDGSGRRRPVPIEGSEFNAKLDTLIAAISEDPDTSCLPGLTLSKWGTVETNSESLITNLDGVFAGGDAVRGPNTVIDAIQDGKRAAVMIDHYLNGKALKTISRPELPSVFIAPAEDDDSSTEEVKRALSPHLEVCKRTGNFDEVELSLTEVDALCEAKRCLRCDLDFTAS